MAVITFSSRRLLFRSPPPFADSCSTIRPHLSRHLFSLASLSGTLNPASIAAPSVDLFSRVGDAAQLGRHYGRCYWELSKACLSMLVVATSGAGFVFGSGSAVDFGLLFHTCGGTMMVFEINNDAKMKRTRQRPLTAGRISVPHVAAWASSVDIAGTALLAYKANALTAGLAASNLILYAFVYTPMKQIDPVNTWVGTVVGTIPPFLGGQVCFNINGIFMPSCRYLAERGGLQLLGRCLLMQQILPTALYFWQNPHFMALAYSCRNGYAAGGFKMLYLGDASGQKTSLVALSNCLYLVPLGYPAYDCGLPSGWFCLKSSLLTLAISATAFLFYRDRTMQKARRMFHASLLYFPVFKSRLLFHRLTDSNNDLSHISSNKTITVMN